MMGREIYRYTVPADRKTGSLAAFVPDAYSIRLTENGLIVYAKFGEAWKANPSAVEHRELIFRLIEKRGV